MDLAAPGLALGIVIGRIGDLAIGDHLGKPTSSPLGWRCLGDVTGATAPTNADVYLGALEAGDPPSLGCYDLVLHQTALYDFASTLVLLGVLLWVGRKIRNPGYMILLFTVWYGAMRVITDFLRVDRRYVGLTGSQLMSLAVGLACLWFLLRFRGAPPGLAGASPPDLGPGGDPEAGPVPVLSGGPVTERDEKDSEAEISPSDHYPP
jgi:prolipoprotein diacylglyceryltransferase